MKQIKMKASKELLNHLSANVGGVTAEGFRTILEAYKGEVEAHKYPIELVNEKYPNGWYCEAFEELIQDVKQADGCDEDWDYPLIGWNFVGARNYNASYEGNETIRLSSKKITSTEYLSITRPQQERDYTGVRFEHRDGRKENGGIIGELENGIYTINNSDGSHSSWEVEKEDVKHFFKQGYWIELPPEPSIHVQLPTDNEQAHIIETLQDCVNDLDARIKQLEAMQAPTLKRNL